MAPSEARWLYRLESYGRALNNLRMFLKAESLNPLEEQGLIKAFELVFELAWNLVKDYLEYQGSTGISGSRDAFRQGFQRGLLRNGHLWMDMIHSRTLTVHCYDEPRVKEIARKIIQDYYLEFESLEARMRALAEASE